MTYESYIALSSEIKELESLLLEIPTNQIINRIGLQSRLDSAKKAVEGISEKQLTRKIRLTFRGRPVLGSHGIAADFATTAAGKFIDAVTTVAASFSDTLKYMGPVPDRLKNQLVITGTAIGSFGFEFEIPHSASDSDGEESEPTNAESAIEKVQDLFRLASEGDNDKIAELVDEIHPRAVKKTADFLDYLSQQDAWCGLEYKNSFFKFKDIGQLQESMYRLREENIRERVEEFSGEFQGILPLSRNYEFKVTDDKWVIKGKIGKAIEDADIINRDFLHKKVRVSFHVVQVGQGRPSYTLPSIESIVIDK